MIFRKVEQSELVLKDWLLKPPPPVGLKSPFQRGAYVFSSLSIGCLP